VRTGAEVERILVSGGRATAVRLADGDTMPASRAVVASVTPTDSTAAKPTDSKPTATTPADGASTAPPEPAKEPKVARVTPADTVTAKPAESNATTTTPVSGATVASTPPSNAEGSGANAEIASSKSTIEIVLKNGRILRVDASTPPEVLTKLITLLEQQP